MRLSDVLGQAGLSVYAQVALVLFVLAFIGIIIYVFAKKNRETFDRARMLPLDDTSSAARANSVESAAGAIQ
jgi:cbb3-type cytochrome oxidase subunit 3